LIGFGVAGSLPSSILNLTQQGGAISLADTPLATIDIFTHNLLLFLLISVLPFANSLLLFVQFLVVGFLARFVTSLSASTQFEILYRHATLEVVALFFAVATSYWLFFSIRRFVTEPGRNMAALKGDLSRALWFYAIIITATGLAAVLEGVAVVQF
jgi:uncharacterized membrane protein SpoIIM required for sporulation